MVERDVIEKLWAVMPIQFLQILLWYWFFKESHIEAVQSTLDCWGLFVVKNDPYTSSFLRIVIILLTLITEGRY